MFTAIAITTEQPENTVSMEETIWNGKTNCYETLRTVYVTPEVKKACLIPARNELKLDYAKIAQIQADREEMLARFKA